MWYIQGSVQMHDNEHANIYKKLETYHLPSSPSPVYTKTGVLSHVKKLTNMKTYNKYTGFLSGYIFL